MRAQRGFVFAAGTLAKLALVLAIIVAISGLVLLVKNYVEKRDATIFAAGETKERAAWQTRESEELARVNAEILRLTSKMKAQAEKHNKEVTNASARYQQALDEERIRRDIDVARVRSGSLVLRDRARRAPACRKAPGNDRAASSGSAARKRDGEAGADLSPAAAAFLLGLAGEADAVTAQLGEAQELLRLYYKACGG